MQLLKCKMCGGDIKTQTDQNYGTCDSCGSVVTLPKTGDEKRTNLFNRADYFRRSNQFERAISAYERLIEEDDQDAEAHWGLVLSRFGIEYVEDPKDRERIPTCHRMQMVSVLADPDYLAALEYAPGSYSRSLYEREGRRISELQKGILAISQQEEPYDVFLCYRETGDAGTRTKESVLAQEIYYELAEAGYRVFFARITLESRLGREYEPYIFAALSSARVMLVLGTSPENFQSVWVKNEWSRFLELMKRDRRRTLIPCYRDMNPYDLPEELSVYQSQDMGKLGFMQDLLRGVEKVLGETGMEAGQSTVSNGEDADATAPTCESLTDRGELFLEDENFQKADEYFERALDINPKYARAYIGKLCAERKCRNEAMLEEQTEALENSGHFHKVMRFGDQQQKQRMSIYQKTVMDAAARESERRKKEETSRLEQELIVGCQNLQERFEHAQQLPEESEEDVLEKIQTISQLKRKLEEVADNQNADILKDRCTEQLLMLQEKRERLIAEAIELGKRELRGFLLTLLILGCIYAAALLYQFAVAD